MLRYPRLFLNFVRFSVGRAMEFRVDFFFRILMDCVYYAVNLSFFKVLYLHTPLLAGWTEPQVMVFVACYLMVDAIQMTLFSNNMWWFPQLVNKGELDYYLIRPVSSLFFISLRDFAANSFLNLVIAAGILAWAIAQSGIETSFGSIALLGLMILNGTFLFYVMNFLTILPVFWTHSTRGLNQMHWLMTRFMERPDRVFRGAVRLLVTTVLPYSLMASFPARFFLEGFNATLFAHTVAVSIAFVFILRFAWAKALRAYSSASS